MLGLDIDKFAEGVDALVRMAEALERLADVAERVVAGEARGSAHPGPVGDALNRTGV